MFHNSQMVQMVYDNIWDKKLDTEYFFSLKIMKKEDIAKNITFAVILITSLSIFGHQVYICVGRYLKEETIINLEHIRWKEKYLDTFKERISQKGGTDCVQRCRNTDCVQWFLIRTVFNDSLIWTVFNYLKRQELQYWTVFNYRIFIYRNVFNYFYY